MRNKEHLLFDQQLLQRLVSVSFQPITFEIEGENEEAIRKKSIEILNNHLTELALNNANLKLLDKEALGTDQSYVGRIVETPENKHGVIIRVVKTQVKGIWVRYPDNVIKRFPHNSLLATNFTVDDLAFAKEEHTNLRNIRTSEIIYIHVPNRYKGFAVIQVISFKNKVKLHTFKNSDVPHVITLPIETFKEHISFSS